MFTQSRVWGAESRPPGQCGRPCQAREPVSSAEWGHVKAAATAGSGTRSAAEGAALTGKGALLGSRRARRGGNAERTHQETRERGAEGGRNAAIYLCLMKDRNGDEQRDKGDEADP